MSMTNRQKQALKTKQDIIKATVEIIRESGYPALTIRNICARANVSTGAFYHYFDKKESIIEAAFREYDNAMEENILEGEADDPLTSLFNIIISLTKYEVQTGHGFTKEIYISQLYSEDSYIVRKDRKYNQMILHYVKLCQDKKLLTQKYTAEYITEYLIRINRGVILDWCFHNYSYDLLEQVSADVKMALDALTEA